MKVAEQEEQMNLKKNKLMRKEKHLSIMRQDMQ